MVMSFDYSYQDPSRFLFLFVNWGDYHLNPIGASK